MNAAATTLPSHCPDDPGIMPEASLPFKLFVFSFLVMPFAVMVFFALQLMIVVLPAMGFWFLFFPKLRVHGLFILGTLAYLTLPNLFLEEPRMWEDFNYMRVVGSIGFILLPYIPEFLGTLIPLMVFLWATLLTPIAVCEWIYWTVRLKQWTLLAASVLLAGVVSYYAVQYGNQCIENYNKAKAFLGQTLPAEELFAQCGQPVYEAKNDGPWHFRPHWVYTNGHWAVPVQIDENGMATVYEREYIFFD